jgi:hypothetical protein
VTQTRRQATHDLASALSAKARDAIGGAADLRSEREHRHRPRRTVREMPLGERREVLLACEQPGEVALGGGAETLDYRAGSHRFVS